MSDFPYPGIRPFSRDETHIFFGREAQTDELIGRLGRSRFLAVVGASGCGKSSLVRTGMIPGLETGFLSQAGTRWQVAEMRPGTRPFFNLAESLSPVFQDAGDALSTEDVEFLLRGGALGLHKLCADHPRQSETNLLIVADQFEELFRYADNPESSVEASAFTALLLAGAKPWTLPDGRASRRIYVVITMRSDFIGDCARFPGLAEAVNDGLWLTPRLNREQLREAISGPPLVTGCDIEPALTNRLLADMADDQDQLPLLQHALQWMWLRAKETSEKSSQLTLTDYEALGGFGQALSGRLDDIYAKELSDEQQRVAEILFRNLSKRDLELRDIRRPVRLNHVAELARTKPEAVADVVNIFQKDDRNFITVSKDADPLLDVCHESLLRQWDRLKDWLNDEAESGAMYSRLEDAALRWKNKTGGFWHGLDLGNALEWRENKMPTRTWTKRYGRDNGVHFPLAMEFLEASQKAEQQAIRKRRTLTGLFIAFLVIVAGVLWIQLEITKKSEAAAQTDSAAAQKAKEKTEAIEKERTAGLFASYLTHASLQAKVEDYAAARKILEQSREIDDDIPATRRHARDLLAWYADLMGGTSEKTYEGAGAPLFKVAVSPDGKLLTAVGEKGTVVLFDAETGEIVNRLKGHETEGGSQESSVRAVVCHPDGKWLATAGADQRILFWTIPDGVILREINTPGIVGALALSPDNTIIASAGKDNDITLWNTDTGKKIRYLEGHTGIISGLAFSPDGRLLASASHDDTAGIWDVVTGKRLYPLRGHAAEVVDVAFHPDGNILASCSADRTVILWQVETGQPFAMFQGHENIVFQVAFTESGDRLISASMDRTLRVWDTDTGVTLRVLQGHPFSVTGLAVKSDTLFSASNDGTVRKWGLKTDGRMRVKDVKGEPSSASIAPNGQYCAIGFDDGSLRLCELPSMERVWEKTEAHEAKIQRIAFGPDGKNLATAGFDNTAKLWRTDDGNLEQTFEGHTDAVHDTDFSPDGRFVATASYDGNIGLFEIGKKEGILFEAHEGKTGSVAFDRDGRKLVSAGMDGMTRLWDTHSQPPKSVRDFPKSADQVMWAAISPDGTRVAAVGRDTLVHVYDADTGAETRRFVGHENAIFRVAFSPDGGQLATVSGDGTVRFWDLETGESLFTLRLPTPPVPYPVPLWDFDFRCTPTGCWIVVPLTRGKILLYRMDNFYAGRVER